MKESHIFEASEFSKPFWYEYQLNNDSSIYNRCGICELGSDLDVNRLEKSIRTLVLNNFNLRTVFFEKDDVLFHKISEDIEGTLFCYETNNEAEKKELLESNVNYPLNLEKGPLFRFVLINQKYNNEYTLLIVFHHAIADGSCYQTLYQELESIYKGNTFEERSNKGDIEKFKSYVAWEKGQIGDACSPDFYQQINDEYYPVNLSIRKNATPSKRITSTKVLAFELSIDTLQALLDFSNETKVSLFNIIKTAWSLLIIRYSKQNKILLSYPVSTRGKQFRDIRFGLVNSLFSLHEEKGTFLEQLLAGVEDNSKLFTANAKYYPAYKSWIELQKTNNISDASALRRVTVVAGISRKLSPELSSKVRTIITPDSTSELLLEYYLEKEKVNCLISYGTRLYDDDDIRQLSHSFSTFLNKLINDPQVPTSQISLLDKTDFNKIIFSWNKTAVDYPRNKTIHQFFEEQVEKTPNKLALFFEDKQLTYREVNEQANQLAYAIRDRYKNRTGDELSSDTFIGIYFERSLEMIVSIFAILKSGGAYVPFDVAEPNERLLEKLEDSGCKLLLTNEELASKLPQVQDAEYITLNKLNLSHYSCKNLNPISHSRNLAYLIYTSGSTGKPKGVMIEHYGVVNLAYSNNSMYNLEKYGRMLQYASVNFDASVTTLFSSLLSGGSLFICPEPLTHSPNLLQDFIFNQKINHIRIPATLLSQLDVSRIGDDLKVLAVAGSQCEVKSLELWSDYVQIVNAYGPTEVTVGSLSHFFKRGDLSTNIGKAFFNKTHYVLDKHMNPVPIGVDGELYIGGDGVARGYLNRPDLTAERFVNNPFINEDDKVKGRNLIIYKTGDICRWLSNGDIEFVGRDDDQIKLRGFRIELGEIESNLNSHDDVEQSVVLCKGENDNKRLIAYYTAREEIEGHVLKDYLEKLLPAYMIPLAFVFMKEFPVNRSGKVEKRALPTAVIKGDEEKYVPPISIIERRICDLYQELLGVDRVGLEDNFFNLGGNSIKVLTFVSRFEAQYGIALPVNFFYKHKTIYQLAREIEIGIYSKTVKHNVNIDKLVTVIEDETPIIPLKEGDSIPIYAITCPPQQPSLYRDFVKCLEGNHAVFSISLSENMFLTEHLDHIAEWYSQKITKHTNKDTFIITGYSLAGLLLLHIAALLEKSGLNPKVLILDTTPVHFLENKYSHNYVRKIYLSDLLKDYCYTRENRTTVLKKIWSLLVDPLLNKYNEIKWLLESIGRDLKAVIKILIQKSDDRSEDEKKNFLFWIKNIFRIYQIQTIIQKVTSRRTNTTPEPVLPYEEQVVNTLLPYVMNNNYDISFTGDISLIKTISEDYIPSEKHYKYNYWNLIYSQEILVKMVQCKHEELLGDLNNIKKTAELVTEICKEKGYL